MTNLIDIYNEIENSINSLYDFDLSSQYKKNDGWFELSNRRFI